MTKGPEYTPKTTERDIKTGEIDVSETARAQRAAVRERRERDWGDILLWASELNDTYASQYIPIPMEEFHALRDAVYSLPDFRMFRDEVSRQVFAGDLKDAGGAKLLSWLFGREAREYMNDVEAVAKFSGIEDKKAAIARKRSYGDVVFSVHQAFMKRLEGILPGSISPQTASELFAAKSADDRLVTDLLWRKQKGKFQAGLAETETGARLPEVMREGEFENKFEALLRKPLTAAETEEEAKRIKTLISDLWDEARGLDLDRAGSHIQKIIFLEKTLKELEAPIPQSGLPIEDGVQALKNKYALGDITKEEYNTGIEELARTASRKETAEVEKILLREAKLLRDLAERCGPNHESYDAFIQGAKRDEAMAALIIKKAKE